eukprot:gene15654-21761_t
MIVRQTQKAAGYNVFLNVYDVTQSVSEKGSKSLVTRFNSVGQQLGVGGLFHGSIELESAHLEWSYGASEKGSGVYCCRARQNTMYIFRKRMPLGRTTVSKQKDQARDMLCLCIRVQERSLSQKMKARSLNQKMKARSLSQKMKVGWLRGPNKSPTTIGPQKSYRAHNSDCGLAMSPKHQLTKGSAWTGSHPNLPSLPQLTPPPLHPPPLRADFAKEPRCLLPNEEHETRPNASYHQPGRMAATTLGAYDTGHNASYHRPGGWSNPSTSDALGGDLTIRQPAPMSASSCPTHTPCLVMPAPGWGMRQPQSNSQLRDGRAGWEANGLQSTNSLLDLAGPQSTNSLLDTAGWGGPIPSSTSRMPDEESGWRRDPSSFRPQDLSNPRLQNDVGGGVGRHFDSSLGLGRFDSLSSGDGGQSKGIGRSHSLAREDIRHSKGLGRSDSLANGDGKHSKDLGRSDSLASGVGRPSKGLGRLENQAMGLSIETDMQTEVQTDVGIDAVLEEEEQRMKSLAMVDGQDKVGWDGLGGGLLAGRKEKKGMSCVEGVLREKDARIEGLGKMATSSNAGMHRSSPADAASCVEQVLREEDARIDGLGKVATSSNAGMHKSSPADVASSREQVMREEEAGLDGLSQVATSSLGEIYAKGKTADIASCLENGLGVSLLANRSVCMLQSKVSNVADLAPDVADQAPNVADLAHRKEKKGGLSLGFKQFWKKQKAKLADHGIEFEPQVNVGQSKQVEVKTVDDLIQLEAKAYRRAGGVASCIEQVRREEETRLEVMDRVVKSSPVETHAFFNPAGVASCIEDVLREENARLEGLDRVVKSSPVEKHTNINPDDVASCIEDVLREEEARLESLDRVATSSNAGMHASSSPADAAPCIEDVLREEDAMIEGMGKVAIRSNAGMHASSSPADAASCIEDVLREEDARIEGLDKVATNSNARMHASSSPADAASYFEDVLREEDVIIEGLGKVATRSNAEMHASSSPADAASCIEGVLREEDARIESLGKVSTSSNAGMHASSSPADAASCIEGVLREEDARIESLGKVSTSSNAGMHASSSPADAASCIEDVLREEDARIESLGKVSTRSNGGMHRSSPADAASCIQDVLMEEEARLESFCKIITGSNAEMHRSSPADAASCIQDVLREDDARIESFCKMVTSSNAGMHRSSPADAASCIQDVPREEEARLESFCKMVTSSNAGMHRSSPADVASCIDDVLMKEFAKIERTLANSSLTVSSFEHGNVVSKHSDGLFDSIDGEYTEDGEEEELGIEGVMLEDRDRLRGLELESAPRTASRAGFGARLLNPTCSTSARSERCHSLPKPTSDAPLSHLFPDPSGQMQSAFVSVSQADPAATVHGGIRSAFAHAAQGYPTSAGHRNSTSAVQSYQSSKSGHLESMNSWTFWFGGESEQGKCGSKSSHHGRQPMQPYAAQTDYAADVHGGIRSAFVNTAQGYPNSAVPSYQSSKSGHLENLDSWRIWKAEESGQGKCDSKISHHGSYPMEPASLSESCAKKSVPYPWGRGSLEASQQLPSASRSIPVPLVSGGGLALQYSAGRGGPALQYSDGQDANKGDPMDTATLLKIFYAEMGDGGEDDECNGFDHAFDLAVAGGSGGGEEEECKLFGAAWSGSMPSNTLAHDPQAGDEILEELSQFHKKSYRPPDSPYSAIAETEIEQHIQLAQEGDEILEESSSFQRTAVGQELVKAEGGDEILEEASPFRKLPYSPPDIPFGAISEAVAAEEYHKEELSSLSSR